MSSNYPIQIDSSLNLPTVVDGFSPVIGSSINLLRDAIVNTQAELGVKPSGIYGTVRARLDALEAGIGGGTTIIPGTTNTVLTSTGSAILFKLLDNSNISTSAAIVGTKISPNFGSQQITTTGDIEGSTITIGVSGPEISKGTGVPASTSPDGSLYLRTDGAASTALYTRQSGTWQVLSASASGSAGGDLSGTYPNPVVVKLQSYNISSVVPTDGYVLTWDNDDGYWAPRPTVSGSFIAGGDLTGSDTNQTVVGIQTYDVDDTAPSDGYLLTWVDGDGYWTPRRPPIEYDVVNFAAANLKRASLPGQTQNEGFVNSAEDGQISLGVNSNTSGSYATITGGLDNSLSGDFDFIGGGSTNAINSIDGYNIIVAGTQNIIDIDSTNCFIGGGQSNTISVAVDPIQGAIIVGGSTNSINGSYTTISGGSNNFTTEYPFGTIAGGELNLVDGEGGAIGGGSQNSVIEYGTIPGGLQNTCGGLYTFAIGYGAHARATGFAAHAGGFFEQSGDAQAVEAFAIGISVNGAPIELKDSVGDDLALVQGHTFLITATCVATEQNTDSPVVAAFINKLLVDVTDAGIATIVVDDPDPANTALLNGQTWTVVYSAHPSFAQFIATFTGEVGITVRAVVRYDWVELSDRAPV